MKARRGSFSGFGVIMDRKLSSRYDKETPGDNLQLQIG